MFGQMRSLLVKVTMTSFCVQTGEGVKTGLKIAVILQESPLKRRNQSLDQGIEPLGVQIAFMMSFLELTNLFVQGGVML